MRKILLIVTGLILLTGCSKETDTFAKRKACQELSRQAMDQIEAKWGTVKDGYTSTGLQVSSPKIYYSSQLDSCIYKSVVIKGYGEDSTTYGTYYINIIDFLNNDELSSIVCDLNANWDNGEEFSKCTSVIDAELKQLEVE